MFLIIRNLQSVNSKPCLRHNFFDGCWTCGDRCDSTAFSTRRFLSRSPGNLACNDLHSGQNHSGLSCPAVWKEIHSWQKLCPQTSVIRIGGVNISLMCSNMFLYENMKLKACDYVEKHISTQSLSILSKLNLRHSFLCWKNESIFHTQHDDYV